MPQLYSNMKIFHYQDKLDSLPANVETILPPIHIRIKPTNVCNHNCWYCGYRKGDIQLGKDMNLKDQIPRQKMVELIEDFKEMDIKAVTFSGGGEPLCYPHMVGTLLELSKAGIKFAALTNGARLAGEVAEVFAHHGTWVRISMDGWDGPSYARYRGVSENEFFRVMTNMENLKKRGGPCYLGVVIIVDEANGSHVYQMIKNLKDTGVNSVKVAPCLVSDDQNTSREYQRPILETVTEQVERAKAELEDYGFQVFNSYRIQLTTFEKNYSWCPYLQINPVIGADLNVYSCHDKAYNLDTGKLFSIREQRFKAGWFASKSSFFRINPEKDCEHHCVVNDKNHMILDYLDVDQEHIMFV